MSVGFLCCPIRFQLLSECAHIFRFSCAYNGHILENIGMMLAIGEIQLLLFKLSVF